MSHFKQYLIIAASSLIRGVVFLVNKLGRILLFFLSPLQKIFYFIFKQTALPVYNILHLIKKRLKGNLAPPSQKFILFFTHKYLLYLVLSVLSLSVLAHNLMVKNVAAEDLGKRSSLAKISQGEEFEEIIKEESQGQLLPSPLKSEQREEEAVDFLKPEQSALSKDELVAGPIATTSLQEVVASEGLTAGTLQKTGIPATLTTPLPRETIQSYLVQSGDTISSIAEKFNISINTILWANDLSPLSIIRPGDKLTILPITGVLYKVAKGDTISGIAKKYGVDIDKILSYNQLVSDEQLMVGQLLIMPGGEIKLIYPRQPSSLAAIFKQPSSQRKAAGFIWPTASRHITQYYSWRHHALDIGGQIGTSIYASLSGKVIEAGWGSGYGYHVIIDHGGGKRTLSAHLSKIYVAVGEQVNQGAVIGTVGTTGWTTGPHLHFEIIINGVKVNPLSYL